MKNLFITVCFLCSLNYCFATLTTPNLTSPANGSTNKAPDELLDWSASSGQTAYEYRYGVTSNLSNAPILTDLISPSLPLEPIRVISFS